MVRIALCLSVVLLSLAAAPAVSAFCRTSSCELGEAERIAQSGLACERDVHACVTEGQPLHWGSDCIDYAVQGDGSANAGLDGPALQRAVEEAFAAWEGAPCPGGGAPHFHARFQGFVSCQRRESVCGGASHNVNTIMFHDQGWPAGPSVIGLTTPAGGTTSGLLVDADLELNSQDFDFTPGASGSAAKKLGDVLAHEVGHFLGLGHSDVDGALMSRDYASLQRSAQLLTADDVAAICAAYPPGAPLECANAGPPAYDACQLSPNETPACELPSMTHDDSGDGGGCSVGRGSRRKTIGALSTLLVGIVFLRRRR